MARINVTRTFLPPLDEYHTYLQRIWDSGQLTNQGQLVHEFEAAAKKYLEVPYFQFVSNGTVALQLSLQALGIESGEIVTTPFSYVATTSAILWQRCKPVFVDINVSDFCIDVTKIEAAITAETKAIMAVHVFGNPCDVDAIERIAQKHGLKVIYDGAHAFGVKYHGKSLLDYGDVSVSSFHATKVFHTIEGGCIISRDKDVDRRADLIKRFGHDNDEHIMLGINGKVSEFNAAMGLCNLNYVDDIIRQRKAICELYDSKLSEQYVVNTAMSPEGHNYSYYPILLESERQLHTVLTRFSAADIYPRRYFYPSLNTVEYVSAHFDCPISEDISKRILCLPLYPGLNISAVQKICEIMLT